jgi:hypothetical protein
MKFSRALMDERKIFRAFEIPNFNSRRKRKINKKMTRRFDLIL